MSSNKRNYALLSEINSDKELWRIRVKVVRLWTQPMWDNDERTGSIHMILMDETGKKIHAIIPSKYLTKFRNLIQENRCYRISNFHVGDSTSRFMLLDNEQNINFHRNTMVSMTELNTNYGSGLDFVKFSDILDHKVVTKFTFDVICEIVGRGQLEQKLVDRKPVDFFKLEVQDLDGLRLEVALWKDYALQINNFFLDPNYVGRVVLMIQMANLKIFQSKYQINSCKYGTRILLNDDLPEIQDFRQRLIERDGPFDMTYRIPLLEVEQALSQGSSQAGDTTTIMERTNILYLQDFKQDNVCMVFGTIKSLIHENGWFYFAHRKCNKKVETIEEADYTDIDYDNTENQPYHCKVCKLFVSDVLARFYVKIRVQDHSGTTTLLLFDREVVGVVHKTAEDLYAKLKADDDLDLFPQELEDLVNKQFLFKIEISKKWNIQQKFKTYTVKKLIDNDEFIKEFLAWNEAPQQAMSQADMSVGDNDLSQQTGSYKNVNSVMGENVSEVDVLKSTAESPSNKRPVEIIDEDGNEQCSTTKRKLKMPRTNNNM